MANRIYREKGISRVANDFLKNISMNFVSSSEEEDQNIDKATKGTCL